MQHLPKPTQEALCARIECLSQRGVLADWGYAVPTTKYSSTTSGSTIPGPPACESSPHDPSTLPIKIPSQIGDLDNCGSSNYICAVRVGSDDGSTWLTLVSELTKEDNINIIVPMGSTPENNLRPTIDSSPLHRMVCSMILVKSLSLGIHFQGTWSWMSAELVMAGPGQPVIHQLVHDLESCFYVLVGIFILLDKPYKPKSDKELTQCFDKYFNTFEPSILKTIMIQADLTWEPFILQHISPYFEPATKLLTCL